MKIDKRTEPVIAIDGEAASGKSTTARLVAEKLSFRHLDTGAMYRAAALAILRLGIDTTDVKGIAAVADRIDIEVEFTPEGAKINLDGEDVGDSIRSGEVSEAASHVSAVGEIRDKLVSLQRDIAADGGIVVEGRDIGTVVFPDAEFKFFITASIEERARRRGMDLEGNSGDVSVEQVKKDLSDRDARDTTRTHSPLKKAEDAVVIDTTDLTVEQQVNQIIKPITNSLHLQTHEEQNLHVHQ